MRHPIDELFERYPALKAGTKPLGIWEHLDRRTYRDEIEFLETPGLALEDQFSVVDSLSKLNHRSGYTAAILHHLGALIEKIPVQFILSDACRMKNVADNTFEVVLSNYMVHHIRSVHKVEDFLSEVYRVGKSWLIVDFQRKIMGPLLMKVAVAPFFPPKVLVEDGVKSIRRAYRAREMNLLLGELKKEGRVSHMHAKPVGLLPYWMIKGRKHS